MSESGCCDQILQSRPYKFAQIVHNSTIFRRIKAAVTFVMYVADIITDVLVGNDLYQKCHTMYSLVAFGILSLPGIVQGIQVQTFGPKSMIGFFKNLLTPIWFLPVVGWKLFINIFYLKDNDNMVLS